VHCPSCAGSGISLIDQRKCTVCAGRGDLPDDSRRTKLCRICAGSGVSLITRQICDMCGGYGWFDPTVERDAPLVFFVEAGTPRTAHLQLNDIFRPLSGEIRICDPYYGMGSLLRLDLLQQCRPIRFLTQNPDRNEAQILPKALQEWKYQHGNVEFRRHNGHDLHDRFVLASSELILLGHGLKDVGNKDSFIIRIRSELAADLIDSVRDSFDNKWQLAIPIA
jgi:hypothetical protein